MSTCHYKQRSLRAWCCPPRNNDIIAIPNWLFGQIIIEASGMVRLRHDEDTSPLLEGEILVELPDGLIKRITSKEFGARFEWDFPGEPLSGTGVAYG